MTDTTEPPKRPLDRGGDRPRSRSAGTGGPRGATLQRGVEPAPPSDDARIAKVMARAGLCSRRDAEGWIAAGRVAVNGRIIDSPALNVGPHDRITVDGTALPDREATRLFLFHKPRGLVTTARDPEGRPTIFENLPEGLPRVVSVGRLDINTEGLMLLTNDGGLARVLELPATGWLRRYRVRANGVVDQPRLDALKSGVTLDGVDYAGIEATLDRVQGANVWLTMGLREGKNREIKRVLESLGLAVTRLIRVSFGPFQLGELAVGAAESVPTRMLRDQLGPDLAAQAGVDFAPREEAPARRGGRTERGDATRPPRGEPPAARAHVSALRSARAEAEGQGRRRIERAATADRKGRAVKIERVIPVGPGTPRDPERPGSRNARRFAAENRDAASPRRPASGRLDDAARPRADRGGIGAKPRGARAPGLDERSRRDRAPDTDRPPRDDRRAAAFPDKPRAPRTNRFGDKPRGERAETFGDKPRGFGGKPGGRPGGFGSDRPATGRNRPKSFKDSGGDRPAGGPGGASRGAPRGTRPKGGGRP